MSIREISRRCELNTKKGVAKFPVFVTAVCGEIEVEDDGETVYLICEWIAGEDEALYFEATPESLYPFLMCQDDDISRLSEIRSRAKEAVEGTDQAAESRYAEQYLELARMVEQKIREEGLWDKLSEEEAAEKVAAWKTSE